MLTQFWPKCQLLGFAFGRQISGKPFAAYIHSRYFKSNILDMHTVILVLSPWLKWVSANLAKNQWFLILQTKPVSGRLSLVWQKFKNPRLRARFGWSEQERVNITHLFKDFSVQIKMCTKDLNGSHCILMFISLTCNNYLVTWGTCPGDILNPFLLL